MTEFIPYFGGLVTFLFGIGFFFGIQEFRELEDD